MTAWPSWFTDALVDSSPREWIVSARRWPWIDGLDVAWQASTLPLSGHVVSLGAEGYPAYVPASPSVQVRTWQTGGGGFTLHIAGTSNFRLAMSRISEGSMVAIYAGRPGVSAESHARIDLGQLVSIQQVSDPVAGLRPVYRLDFAPWWAALRRRPAANFASKLFNFAGATSSVDTSNYTAGSGSLTVTNGALFERQASGYGIVKVTPNSGDDFYLEVTAVSGNVLTVSTTAKFGTTDANANIGQTVANIVYLRGHPASILRRLLVSTGTADFSPAAGAAVTAGDNGDYDVYPETWGFGISPDDVDLENLAYLKKDVMTVTSASGEYLVEILVESAPDNAVDWLTSWMRPLGMFLRLYQGQVSAWAAQDPYASGATGASFANWRVTDALLMPDRMTWRPVAGGGQHDSSTVQIDADTHPDASKDSAYLAAPVFYIRTRDCTGILRSDLGDHAEDVNGRCSPWDTRILSELGGQWAGGFYARLGLGELTRVSASTMGLFLPEQADSGDILDQTPAMVTAGPVLDLLNARVWLGLTLLPES